MSHIYTYSCRTSFYNILNYDIILGVLWVRQIGWIKSVRSWADAFGFQREDDDSWEGSDIIATKIYANLGKFLTEAYAGNPW
jgi:hypothetical protein